MIIKPRLADLSRGALPGSWEALMVPTKTLHGGTVSVVGDSGFFQVVHHWRYRTNRRPALWRHYTAWLGST